jgi:hypothetical protein
MKGTKRKMVLGTSKRNLGREFWFCMSKNQKIIALPSFPIPTFG